jgi:SAM-dependent methyltransferase
MRSVPPQAAPRPSLQSLPPIAVAPSIALRPAEISAPVTEAKSVAVSIAPATSDTGKTDDVRSVTSSTAGPAEAHDELDPSELTIDESPPSDAPSAKAAPAEPTIDAADPARAAAATAAANITTVRELRLDADEEEPDLPSNRISEIPPEVDPEDLEITEMPGRAGGLSPPGPPPLLPMPSYARPDLAAAVEAERANEDPSVRRARYWWDEMFGDDFLRTMDQLTPRQVKREVDFIEESLGVQQGAIILDLACGTGKHAVELAVRGYNVVGYDLSVAMLARAADEAHDRNQKLNFLQGDMRDMGFEEMFDAVYCWSTSFGFFDDEKNQLVAQRIHRALRKGGLLLLDVANRDFVAKVQPSLVWFEGDGCVCMDDMRVDFITSRLRVKRMMMMDSGRTRELDYSIRLYTLHELGNMLHDVGFKVIEVSGHLGTPKVFMGADSPRLLVLAEKA